MSAAPDAIAACAGIVERGDPARFRAVMAAPVAARAVLFPVHAFTLEVARAPHVTKEPMIAEMRLQWWRDALEEIADGQGPRRHEVVEPLAAAVGAEGARTLDAAVVARRGDIVGGEVVAADDLEGFLRGTAGVPLWVAARALGAPAEAEDALIGFGMAGGLARYFAAVPELASSGRAALPAGVDIPALARQARARLAAGAPWRARLGRTASAPMLEAWTAGPILRMAERDPDLVDRGGLALSPHRESWRLLRLAARSRWSAQAIS
ncbi:squalene/phytoene synthase family protein [Tropicimonas sp. IMCC34011]|uniref:squalene/phytoene synthase family protein n=1 Tax=Tropicimonas sp. IMCC34011 TaxID=2248759 RepID=UPI000E24FF48|nr:squalene/phytoene synthase family protein [Tropicimonas sp. IMCC34011]